MMAKLDKPYFTKYLHAEGNVKVGDKIRSESCTRQAVTVTGIEDDIYWTDELDFHEAFGTSYFGVRKDKAQKLGKLTLCSRDIQAGDKYFHNLHPLKEFEANEVLLDKIKNQYYPLDTYPLPNEHLFKVIGEISQDALSYVKEGDEFNEEQIRKFWQPGGEDSETWNLVPFDMLTESFNAEIKPYLIIKVKGPCGHFH